jgi:hypothetical protein
VGQYSPAGAVHLPCGSSSWRTNDAASSGTSALARSESSSARRARSSAMSPSSTPRSAARSAVVVTAVDGSHRAWRRRRCTEASSETSRIRMSGSARQWGAHGRAGRGLGGPPVAGPVGLWLSTAGLPVKGAALRFASLRDGPAGRPGPRASPAVPTRPNDAAGNSVPPPRRGRADRPWLQGLPGSGVAIASCSRTAIVKSSGAARERRPRYVRRSGQCRPPSPGHSRKISCSGRRRRLTPLAST